MKFRLNCEWLETRENPAVFPGDPIEHPPPPPPPPPPIHDCPKPPPPEVDIPPDWLNPAG
jgi:hypothetical protein